MREEISQWLTYLTADQLEFDVDGVGKPEFLAISLTGGEVFVFGEERYDNKRLLLLLKSTVNVTGRKVSWFNVQTTQNETSGSFSV